MTEVLKLHSVRRTVLYRTSAICLLALSGCSFSGQETSEGVVSAKSAVSTQPAASVARIADIPLGARAQLVSDVHEPVAEHTRQSSFLQWVASRSSEEAFEEIFELGDELFDADFNTLDGGGANVGNGMRFSRVPRADLKGEKQWASHVPFRHTGPNAQSCTACHNQPFEDGAGGAAMNVVRDPLGSGEVDKFIVRNTTHLFGIGALQRLAEEMTVDLHEIRDQALLEAEKFEGGVSKNLISKGISYGKITAFADGEFDLSEISGVDEDLVVKPLQWKGTDVSVRKFTRNASHREIGVQPVELVGYGVDGDFDGVIDEMTVGDVTAMTVYLAGQPRPVTRLELVELGFDELGLIDPLEPGEEEAITSGEQTFDAIGCASCHTPQLTLDDPVFSEPSQVAAFRDEVFPSGQDPIAEGVDPDKAIKFDLTKDLPDNHLEREDGTTVAFGNFESDDNGGAAIRLYGDLKRHDLGAEVAEPIDEEDLGGSSIFMTAELWGVGDTAPYLHDGRALTLTDAIVAHGGDADSSRKAFEALPIEDQSALIAFLNNLVLFKMEEEEEDEDDDETGVALLER